MRRLLSIVAIGIVAAAGWRAWPEQPRGVPQPPEKLGGLAVHIGSSDGHLEIDLAGTGRWLVQGLAMNAAATEQARQAIQAKGLYGLASIQTLRDPQRLPYADNLVQWLVADLDALGAQAPPLAELERVVSPLGILCLKQRGQWSTRAKPRPAGMDEWRHFDHGPDGNGVSRDKLVKQPNFVQWIGGEQAIKLGGNPAGFVNLTGIRVSENVAVFDYLDDSGKKKKSQLACRDAFSGVPLWTVPRDVEAGMHRWQLVLVSDRIYTALKKNGPLEALDPRDGKVLHTFDQAGPITARNGEASQVRVAGDYLLLNCESTLYAVHRLTGKLLWKYSDPDHGALLFPVADAATNHAFVAVASADTQLKSRWPWSTIDAVVCLQLQTGKPLWRNTDVKGKPVGQLVYSGPDKLLGLFCGSAIGGRGANEGGGWVSSISVDDGKLHGDATFKVAYNDSMYNAIIREGTIFYAGHTSIYAFDPRAGTVSRKLNLSYNQRCNRFCATEGLFITGYVTYLDDKFAGSLQSVARAGCALGATPANGMVYFTPNACRCFTMLRGYMALSPEPIGAAIADDKRLEKGPGKAWPVGNRAEPAFAEKNPIVAEWRKSPDRAFTDATEPVKTDSGLSLVARIHEHRLEARDDAGKLRWAFVAGGRISQAPLVHDGRVMFACHDGWIYCLNAADGALLWRYLVAPYERQMLAYGQLESSWPVYGLTLHQGLVCGSGGLHLEIGGGVVVVGLDPKTGQPAWRRTLRKNAAPVATNPATGKATAPVVPQGFLNGTLKSEGEHLNLQGFAFDPRSSDAELQLRLETPPKKK